jgi:hypothetical protein
LLVCGVGGDRRRKNGTNVGSSVDAVCGSHQLGELSPVTLFAGPLGSDVLKPPKVDIGKPTVYEPMKRVLRTVGRGFGRC